MHKILLLCTLFAINLVIGQDKIEEVKTPSPKKAALWSIVPGGGQLYNGKYVKAGLIVGLEVLSVYFWQENADRYQNYEQLSAELDLPKSRYLQKRNKYAWWVGILYFYGMLDAVVDAHLMSFKSVMDEDIDKGRIEKNKGNKEK